MQVHHKEKIVEKTTTNHQITRTRMNNNNNNNNQPSLTLNHGDDDNGKKGEGENPISFPLITRVPLKSGINNAANTIPNAAQTPIAGAPRTRSILIASHT